MLCNFLNSGLTVYSFLHVSIMPFPKIVKITKTYHFFLLILHLAPLTIYRHVHRLVLKNKPIALFIGLLFSFFFLRGYPTSNTSAPGPWVVVAVVMMMMIYIYINIKHQVSSFIIFDDDDDDDNDDDAG